MQFVNCWNGTHAGVKGLLLSIFKDPVWSTPSITVPLDSMELTGLEINAFLELDGDCECSIGTSSFLVLPIFLQGSLKEEEI